MAPLHIYRRRLPHWRIEGSTYFVTWRLEKERRHLDGAERDIVLSALLHFHTIRYTLHAFVVMNDHVHVLVEPNQGVYLEELIHSWKSFTVRRFHQSSADRAGRVWQPEYWDRLIRDPAEFQETLEYIANNPFKRWGDEIGSYPWVWIADSR